MGTESSKSRLAATATAGDWLLPLHESLLYESELFGPQGGAYVVPVVIDWEGPLDVARLIDGFALLRRRHVALWAPVVSDPEGWPEQPPPPCVAIYSGCSVDDAFEALARMPWQPDVGELFRLGVLRLSEESARLLVLFHHVAGDRASMELFLAELSAAYFGGLDEPAPGEPKARYLACIREIRAQLKSPCGGRLAEEIEASFEGLPDSLPMRWSESERSLTKASTRRVSVHLGQDLTRQVERSVRLIGATPAAAVTAAYALALGACGASSDVPLSIPMSLRDYADAGVVIGSLVETVPLRVRVEAHDRIIDIINRCFDLTTEAFERRWVPFAEVVRLLRLAGSGDAPVVQHMVAWGGGQTHVEHKGVSLTLNPPLPYPTNLDTTLLVHETSAGWFIAIDYAAHAMSALDAEVLLQAFIRCIDLVAHAPECRVDRIEWAPSSPDAATNRGTAVPDERSSLREALELANTLHGSRCAVLDASGRWLTYAALHRRGRLIAEACAASAPGGGPVALCVRRSLEFVTALVGLIASGRHVVLLDPNDAPARRSAALQSAGAELIVRDQDLPLGLDDSLLGVFVEDLRTVGGGASLPVALDPAIVVFTSGTAGAPKPVIVRQAALRSHASWFAEALRLTADDRVLQFCNLAFDAMLEEVLPALTVGACVVLRSEAAAESAEGLIEFCTARQISVVDLPTAFFNVVAPELERCGIAVPRLLRVVIGGERASDAALRAWSRTAPPESLLLNTYGPTEATVIATVRSWRSPLACEPAELGADIGVARRDAVTRVLDRWFREVPYDAIGELYLAGGCVASGYLGMPAETAARFLPDPSARHSGGVMYRTGDLVRRRRDGRLTFMGRADREVKIGGVRVALGAVEAALVTHPHVFAAAALSVIHSDVTSLVAFVESSPQIDFDDLRAHLGARLSRHGIPGKLQRLESMPRTARGKIDYAALSARRTANPTSVELAESGDVDLTLVLSAAAEAVGNASLSSDDDFFLVGGHSLTALAMIADIQRRSGRRITVRDLVEVRTFGALAARLARSPSLPSLLTKHESFAPRGDAAVSSLVQALLIDESLFTGGSPYTIREDLVLREVDIERLREALHCLVESHVELRRLLQTDPDGRFLWKTLTNTQAVDLILRTDASEGALDLSSSPCLRLRFDARDQRRLSVEVHHACVDGLGLEVLLQDFATAYRTGRLEPRFAKSRDGDDASRHDANFEWWRGALASADFGVSPPGDFLPQRRRSSAAVVAKAELRRAGLLEMLSLGPRTLFSELLSTVTLWLHKACSASDLVVGIAVDRRGSTQAAPALANTVVLPLRSRLLAADTPEIFAARIANSVADALDHSLIDLGALARLSGSAGSRAVPSVLFDVDDGHLLRPLNFGIPVERIAIETNTVRSDLEISVRVRDAGLDVTLRGRDDSYQTETLQIWARSILTFIEQVTIEGRYALLAAMPLPSDTESRSIVKVPAAEFLDPVERILHFVARCPDRIAVGTDTRSFSFRELVASSAALAHELRGRLPREGRPVVGLQVRRSVDFVVGLLGCWLSGCIPALIDPAHPLDRRMAMLGIARAKVLIADADEAVTSIPLLRLPMPMPTPMPTPMPGPTLPKWEPPPAETAAYIAFTSGSTGLPRPVGCLWRGLRQLLGWSARSLPLGIEDVFLHVAAPGFDIALWEVLHPLACGARVEIMPAAEHGDVGAIVERLVARGVTATHFVPTVLESMLDSLAPETVLALKWMVVGGESFPKSVYERLRQRLDVAVRHAYGPTETSIFVLTWAAGELDARHDRLPLGEPVSGVTVEVTDPAGHPVPRGIVGELRISGTCLTLGYIAQPAETAGRFAPAINGELTFRSGDLARMSADGTLFFHGRRDRQLKLNGIRIELGEIEAALERTSGVARAVVFRCADGRRDVLVAFLLGEAQEIAADDTLAQRAQEQAERWLPRSVWPAALKVLPALPLTPNSKVDRKLLQQQAEELLRTRRAEASREAGTFHTANEQIMADLWAAVLPGSAIGRDSDFFQLGGDSIAAMRIVALAKSRQVRLSVRALFEMPVLAQLASSLEIEAAHPQADSASTLHLTPAARDWLDRFGEDLGVGVQTLVLESRALQVLPSLVAAIPSLVRRHDSLRLRLHRNGATWYVSLAAPADAMQPVRSHDWDGNELAAAIDVVRASTTALVDPLAGRMLVAAVLQGSDRAFLVLACHHLAVDATSWEILKAELEQLLAGWSLTEPVVSYARAANALLALESYGESAPHRAIASEREPMPIRVRGKAIIPASIAQALRGRARSDRLRTEDVIAAATLCAYSRRNSRARLTFAIEGDGRSAVNDLRLDATVGWFSTLQRYTLDVETDAPATAWLITLRSARLGALSQDAAEIVVNVLVEREASAVEALIEHPTTRMSIPTRFPVAVEASWGSAGLVLEVDIEARPGAEDVDVLLREIVSCLHEIAGIADVAQLTGLQEGILAACLRSPAAGLYHTQVIYELEGEIDLLSLRKAWRCLHEDFDVFRACVDWSSGDAPQLIIGSEAPFIWEELRSDDVPAAATLARCLELDRAAPFDLARAPLSRLRCVVGPDSRWLVWSHHHILFDGWSLPLVAQGVADRYGDQLTKRASRRLEPRYCDLMRELATERSSLISERWARRLNELEVPSFVYPKTAAPRASVETIRFALSGTTSDRLRRLCRERHITLLSCVAAAWCVVLGRHTGNAIVAFGLVTSMRERELEGIDGLIGFCMNTVPVVATVPRRGSLLTFVEECRALVLTAIEEASGSLSQALRLTARARVGADAPFDSLLVFENYPGDRSGVNLAGGGRLRVHDAHENSEFPCVLICLPDQELRFELAVRAHAGEQEIATSIVTTLSRALDAMAGASERMSSSDTD